MSLRRGGHSSGTPVAGRLEQPTRAAWPTDKALRRLTRRVSLLFGFAPGGACHAADVAARAVRSYRTLSPLPSCFTALRPAIRRFAFCGAFPGVAPAGCYPAPYPYGARTFLRLFNGGRPADWPRRHRRAKQAWSSLFGPSGRNRVFHPQGGNHCRACRLKLNADCGIVATGGRKGALAALLGLNESQF